MKMAKQQVNDFLEEVDNVDDYGSNASMESASHQSPKKSQKKKELNL
jgi:hypothetical protein